MSGKDGDYVSIIKKPRVRSNGRLSLTTLQSLSCPNLKVVRVDNRRFQLEDEAYFKPHSGLLWDKQSHQHLPVKPTETYLFFGGAGSGDASWPLNARHPDLNLRPF